MICFKRFLFIGRHRAKNGDIGPRKCLLTTSATLRDILLRSKIEFGTSFG
jgi:hypothetical protein